MGLLYAFNQLTYTEYVLEMVCTSKISTKIVHLGVFHVFSKMVYLKRIITTTFLQNIRNLKKCSQNLFNLI